MSDHQPIQSRRRTFRRHAGLGRRLAATSTLLLLFALAPLWSCAGTKERSVPGSEKTWSSMSSNEKSAHMAKVVMPTMKTLFQDHDPERFASFNCATCHGADGKSRGFAMPNPSLPVLDPSRTYKAHRDATPEMADFMWEIVEPEMAKLLGTKRLVLAHDRRFNCSACHIQK